MYEIFYKPSAIKEIDGLGKKDRLRAVRAIEAIKKGDFFKVEKLGGTTSFYRSKRAWPYRILFTLEGQQIRITNVVHRQGAYK